MRNQRGNGILLAYASAKALPSRQQLPMWAAYAETRSRKLWRQLIDANLLLLLTIVNDIAGLDDHYDDIMSRCLEMLPRAVRGFDATIGYEFSSYLSRCVRVCIRLERKSARPVSRIPAVAVSTVAAVHLDDLVDELHASTEPSTDALDVSRLLQTLSAKERRVMKLMMTGFSGEEIATKLNCSRQYVHQLVRIIGNKMREQLTKGELPEDVADFVFGTSTRAKSKRSDPEDDGVYLRAV